jgi:hypothetical protein
MRRGTTVVLVVLTLALPGVAYSATAFDWLDNVTVPAGYSTGTGGYAPRAYVEASRPTGLCTQLAREDTGNHYGYSQVNCNVEPYRYDTNGAYVRAWCLNKETSSYYTFIYCRTTKP